MQFHYQVRNQQGNIEAGALEAPNREAAIDALQRSRYIIIDLRESAKLPVWSKGLSFSFLQRVPKKEIVLFSRQISTLFQAKVPLIESLRTMMEQTENQKFKGALLDIAKNVDAGSPLSKSLANHRNIFSDFYISMIRSGEASGQLEDTFGFLADGLEREYYLSKKFTGAMTYPAFIITGFVGVIFVMMIWVVPNLTSVLKETGQEMPLMTRIVIGFSDTFASYWWAILLVIAGIIGGFLYAIRTKQGKMIWHVTQLKLPIIGKIVQKFFLARFADNLSVLIKGGLPIVEALQITSEVVNNEVYKDILKQTVEEVKKGNTISSVLKTKQEIPIMISQMVYVGETAGKLEQTLKAAADFYQKEVTTIMDSLVTLIEPILIVALGVGVAILLVAVLMPMYNIANNF